MHSEIQWIKKNNFTPASAANNFWLDVYFLPSDPNYGWLCGFNGMVARSTDAGESWKAVEIFTVNQLESVCFPSKNIGYTSGDGKIFKSINGGATWTEITPFTSDVLLWGNYFITDNIGVVCGGDCNSGIQKFYRTTNGGNTWQTSTYSKSDSKLSDPMLLSAAGLGYASSSGWIWETTDGGKTWSDIAKTGGNDWQEEITNYGDSFLVPFSKSCDGNTAANGGVRFSTDRGHTWKETSYPGGFYGTFLINEHTGWACGSNGSMYYTDDGGSNWTSYNCGLEETSLDDVWFVNDSIGYTVGQGVYKINYFTPAPPVIAANKDLTICEGDSLELFVNKPYLYYNWSNGSSMSEIKITKSGNYWVKTHNSICDSGTSNVLSVKVIPKPVINITASKQNNLCKGDTVVLQAQGTFDRLEWVDGNMSNSISITESGKYICKAFNSLGCYTSDSIDISFADLPEPKVITSQELKFCIGDTIVLSADKNYESYDWIKSDMSSFVSHSKSINVTQSGDYSYIAHNSSGCSAFSDIVTVKVIDAENSINFELAPGAEHIDFGTVVYPEIACLPIKITNSGLKDVVMDNVYLFYKIAFSIPQNQLPLTILPGQTKELTVCYSPTQIGIETDTLLFDDVCRPHLLPLQAEGKGHEYTSDSKCSTEVTFTPVKFIKGTSFISYTPYPNPTTGQTKVKMVYKSDKNSSQPSGVVYNSLGEEIAAGIPVILYSNAIDDGELVTAEFSFNLNNFRSGVYFIKIEFNGSTKIEKILLNK